MQWYVDKTTLEHFTYGAISSSQFEFIIIENDNLSGFENDFELIEIPGRSGELIVDNKRKRNKEINIVGLIDCSELNLEAEEVSMQVNDWLCGEVKYKPLIFSDDIVKYEAIVKGTIKIKKVINNLLEIKLTFSCKPFEGVGK